MQTTPTTTDAPDFAALLAHATTEPGILSECYSRFHQYSIGNMLLAFGQLQERGIPLGPIASFHAWKDLGRHVTKGQKAIQLCQPVTCKRRPQPGDDGTEPATFTRFVYRRNWFALAQTEGAEYQPAPPPAWDRSRALAALDITEIPFESLNGNVQGYAKARSIAVSPVAALPYKTTFHELAHVIIGHTTEAEMRDDERTPRDLREVEAESVALLCCAALGLPGVPEARGYVQHWYGTGQPIPEASARKILKTADAILRAGRVEPTADTETDATC